MLQFEHIECLFFCGTTGLDYFKQNPVVQFTIRAPIYWWVDTDWAKYCMSMPLNDFEFCFDAFGEKQRGYLHAGFEHIEQLNPRQLMQVLPMATIVRATIELHYQTIVEICENYLAGEYEYVNGYSFPDEREWKDFCETLLDIKGIRDLVKEEK